MRFTPFTHNLSQRVFCSLTALALSVGAQAADEEKPEDRKQLQKVVVSAAGYEQKITDAPASISVVTAEELRERPYATLLDAVRDLEGVDVGETRDKTGQGTISMRGMGSDYTLILVNGRRVSNHGDIYPNSFGGNQFNHIPPLDSIERIEVIRGPAATLYGADALGGVINIITRKDAKEWSGSATVGRTTQTDSAYGDDTTVDVYASGPLIPGKLNASVRGSWYDREPANPTYSSMTDPAGTEHTRSLAFGGGGKTVDNTNVSGGFSLTWMPTQNQTVNFDFDTSRQEYDNSTKINDAGVEEYPVGTVDDYGSMLRIGAAGNIEPRAGYAAEQEFTRDTWSFSHDGEWDFGKSFISLAHVSTNNNGRTLPYTVSERQGLQGLWNTACSSVGGSLVPPTGTIVGDRCTVASSVFNNNWSEARKLEFMGSNLNSDEYAQLLAYLPRPKRTLESRQYTLDGRLDMPFELAGQQHIAIVGGQVIRGELEDGVFGMEAGKTGDVQKHDTWSVFAEDTWYVLEPLAITAGARYDNHNVYGGQTSPRLYGVYTLSEQITLKGGVTTGYKAPKTTQLFDGVIGFGGQGVSPMYGNPNLKPETSVNTELALYWQHPDRHNFNITLFQNDFKDKIASGQPCGGTGDQPCHSSGDFAELGVADGATRTGNIDKAELQGVEIAGRWQVASNFSVRANYTYTESEVENKVSLCTNTAIACNNSNPKEEVIRKLPMDGNNIAKHMANMTLDWQTTDKLNVFLSTEFRGDRYRRIHNWSDVWTTGTGYSEEYHGKKLYFKDYTLLHLGANYKLLDNLTLNARVNNLLDRNFTTYQTEFFDRNNNGSYDPTTSANEVLFLDDYNNKESRRSFWVSANYRF